MIERPTVFILGAGASAPYGFPLGSELARDIVGGLEPSQVPTDQWLRDVLVGAKFRAGDLDEFRDRLRESGGRSIDFFLEGQSPEYVAIGKAAIALRVLKAEDLCKRQGWLTRTPPPDDHWLGYLWELMRPGCDPANLASNTKVSFVTFNYDRTLERFFDTVMQNSFGLTAAKAKHLRASSIKIVHLHGAIPDAFAFGHYRADSALRAREASEGLVVINEKVGPDSRQLALAHTMFRDAELICLLGFGFHKPNAQRLELARLPERVPIVGSVYKMGAAEIERAKRWIGRTWSPADPERNAASFLREDVELY